MFFLSGTATAGFTFGDTPNSRIFWKAYSLPAEQGKASQTLLALTVLPPEGEYLYGAESAEGLPTTLDVTGAQLQAFPMVSLKPGEIQMLAEEEGVSYPVRAPRAVLKSETRYAHQMLAGMDSGNPSIYPDAVTFWVELPAVSSGLGGMAVHVRLSGLLCSASSCTPAFGELSLAFSAREAGMFLPAAQEGWWSTFLSGENVFIPPPESAMLALPPDGNAADSPFSGGKSLLAGGTAHTPEGGVALGLEQWKVFFASLEPAFFNPDLEVQFLGEALLFGLLAGLLLNLMPCVLPVVSLKFSALMAVSAMTDKQEQARAFRLHCLIFALGIMTWFVFLAFMLGVVGWAWGELFQKPAVLVGLGLFLFLLGLSMFGVFSLPLFDLKPSNDRHPHWQAFMSGLLATLLATPCSGPLLGGVLAWAIRQPLPVLGLSVLSIGVGMAFPYGVLALRPGLVHLLPRPGNWTLRLQQLLGFFLMGSVVYLATLLPENWTAPFLFNLFALAFAAWLWGQIGHLGAGTVRRALSRIVAVAVMAFAVILGASSLVPDPGWEAFEPQEFMELVGEEALLLQFTADWCPNCKALEHTTLSKSRMEDLRRRYRVRTIRVDLTRDADAGKELLRALDSTSIPVIALFPKGDAAKKPVVLRDIVTPAQLEEAALATFKREVLFRGL